MIESNHNKLHHHLAVAAGLVGLFLWLYIGMQLGFLDWVVLQVSEKYAGAALMVGIMILMTPGFYLWTLYNRWIEKRLNVKGTYIEDEYYKDNEALKNKRKSKD